MLQGGIYTIMLIVLILLLIAAPIFGEEILNTEEIYKYVNEYYQNAHRDFWGVWHIYAWQKWALAEKLIALNE